MLTELRDAVERALDLAVTIATLVVLLAFFGSALLAVAQSALGWWETGRWMWMPTGAVVAGLDPGIWSRIRPPAELQQPIGRVVSLPWAVTAWPIGLLAALLTALLGALLRWLLMLPLNLLVALGRPARP